MSRRKLLAMLPATAAVLATRSDGAPISKSALTAAGFGISVQCWSFKEFTLFEAIGMAAAAGADGVEVFPGQLLGAGFGDTKLGPDLSDAEIQALLDHVKEHGLVVYNLGVIGVPNDEKKAREIFDLGRKLGLYGISTEAIQSIDLLEKLSGEYDIKVCFHNHPRRPDQPDYKMWDPDFVFAAVQDRHPNVGICADIGHWATTGLDPVEVIRKVAPRVHSFHMKDRAEIGRRVPDMPFGRGIIDNITILDEVSKHGFAGNVSIEYEHNWKTNVPEVAQCAGYLRGYSKVRGGGAIS